jgi:hypothetical protein
LKNFISNNIIKITIYKQNTFIQESKLFEQQKQVDYYYLCDTDNYSKIVPYKQNIMLKGIFVNFKIHNDKSLENMRYFIYSNEDYMYAAYNKYNKIKDFFGITNDEDIVSIYFDDDDQQENNLAYYKKAIIMMNKNYYVIFSKDAEHLMKLFEEDHNVYVVWDDNIYVRFILLSLFQHNIVQFYKPYFSLWASYISKYESLKNVIIPDYVKRICNPHINNLNIISLE